MHNSLFLRPRTEKDDLLKKRDDSYFAPAKTKIIYYQECTREWQVKKKVLFLLLQNNYHFTRISFRLRNIFNKLRFSIQHLNPKSFFAIENHWLRSCFWKKTRFWDILADVFSFTYRFKQIMFCFIDHEPQKLIFVRNFVFDRKPSISQ